MRHIRSFFAFALVGLCLVPGDALPGTTKQGTSTGIAVYDDGTLQYPMNGTALRQGDGSVQPWNGTGTSANVVCISGCAGSGGTSATDNSAFTGGTTNVTPFGALFKASPPAITDGNIGAPTMDSSRRLYVNCASGCSGSSFADNAAFTFGTTTIQPIAGVFDDVSTNTATENSAAVVRITAQKGLHINLRNASGTEIGTSGAPIRTDPTGTTAQPVTNAGTFATQNTQQGTASQNVAQLAGTTTDTNSGVKSAGTLRVVLATDQPALTNKLLVTPDSVALPANQSVNVSQINGVTPLMGAGATGTGAQRVNDVSSSATGAAPPASASFIAGLGSGATGGFLVGIPVADTFKSVSVTSATTTLLVTGVSGRHVRISSLNLVTAIANNVALISGTGATCGTGTAGIAGGTTAANGWNFAANGGVTLGSGLGTVLQTAATGDSVCVITSAAGPLAGALSYAIY